jgi:hypothetical protein
MRWSAIVLCLLSVQVFAKDDLEEASRLFKEMKYQNALQVAERMLKSPEMGPKDLIEAYQIQGLCLSALGRKKESTAAFKRLLAIDPSFRLSKSISPKLTPPFSQALDQSLGIEPISLNHTPPDSVLTLDGAILEMTLKADPLGMIKSVRFRYRLAGGEEQKMTVQVKGQKSFSFSLPESITEEEVQYQFEALNEYGGLLALAAPKDFQLNVKSDHVAVVMPPLTGGANATGNTLATSTGAETESADDQKKSKALPWYKTWWFWTAVGVVATGAAVGTALAASPGGSSGGPYYYHIEIK